jgi:hypothetical protein
MFFLIKKSSSKAHKAIKLVKTLAFDTNQTRKKLARLGFKGELAESMIEDALWGEKKEPGFGQKVLKRRIRTETLFKSKNPEMRMKGLGRLTRLTVDRKVPVESTLKRLNQLFALEPELRFDITDVLVISINEAKLIGNYEYAVKAQELLRKLAKKI